MAFAHKTIRPSINTFTRQAVSTLAVLAALAACSKENDVDQSQNDNCTDCKNTNVNNVTTTITPEGGEVVSQGGIKLVVPKGALDKATALTIRDTAATEPPALPTGATARGPVIALLPHEQTFAVPATLTMPLPTPGAPIRLWTASKGGSWKLVPGSQILATQATAPIDHFSFFALLEGGSDTSQGGNGGSSGQGGTSGEGGVAGGGGASGQGGSSAGQGGSQAGSSGSSGQAGAGGKTGASGQSGGGQGGAAGKGGDAGASGQSQGGAGQGGSGAGGEGGQSGAGGLAGEGGSAGDGGSAGSGGCDPSNLCGNVCVDLMNDPQYCGDCWTKCQPGAVCKAGNCECPSGTEDCSGTCTDTQNDPQNCNLCGFVCGNNEVCNTGSCECPAAAQCAEGCYAIGNDPLNCGGCDKVCPLGAACTTSVCSASANVVLQENILSFASDGNTIFYSINDKLFSMPLAGGPSTPLYTCNFAPPGETIPAITNVRLQDGIVFFICGASVYFEYIYPYGKIVRLDPSSLVTSEYNDINSNSDGFEVDKTHLYSATGATLTRFNIDGSAKQIIASNLGDNKPAFALTNQNVYFATQDNLIARTKATGSQKAFPYSQSGSFMAVGDKLVFVGNLPDDSAQTGLFLLTDGEKTATLLTSPAERPLAIDKNSVFEAFCVNRGLSNDCGTIRQRSLQETSAVKSIAYRIDSQPLARVLALPNQLLFMSKDTSEQPLLLKMALP